MIRLALSLVLLATTGCQYDPLNRIKAPPKGTSCTTDGLDPLIGKMRTDRTERLAKLGSGANTLRWITPEMMVTMDYREDRLNVHLGTDGRIGSVKCG